MKNTARLRQRILSRAARIGVVGQGYVGVSLACAAAEAGFEVVGIDVDHRRVDGLAAGELVVPGVPERAFRAGVSTGRVRFSTDHADIEDLDVVLICVATPVRDHTPDLSQVERACKEVASYLTPGKLVILESTTYPGTTDEVVKPGLETSGLVCGHDFLLAYSPDRIDPGNEEYLFRNTPRIVGGTTPEATGMARLFYAQIVEDVSMLSSSRAAELAKLLENTFRHVNIALVNEMAMLCHEMGIDVWEVIDAAATKPFGFMKFRPGPGVGGHCIPLDPMYLAWQVRREAGHQFRILEQAQDVNAQMPTYVASRIGDVLNDAGRAVKGARIMILGVSYKPDVGDVRESPAVKVMEALHRRGAKVSFNDPYVGSVRIDGAALMGTELTQRSLGLADCVAVLTPHSAYDLGWIAGHAALVFDATNAFGDISHLPQVVRL
jgi:UDP-N-acetyl-D-glucosamine dehydrogenase